MSLQLPLIQIAGVRNAEEADLIIKAGCKYIGFPLRLDYHKEDIPDSDAQKIIKNFPDGVYAVLITYLNRADEIIALTQKINARIVQIHGDISIKELILLKTKAQDIKIIKSLIVNNNSDELIYQVKKFTEYTDAFITDTYDPVTGAKGATGKTHDWKISKKIVEISKNPVIIAGGLNQNNVRNAINIVKPAGVDAHTGVEDKNGFKNMKFMSAFYKNAMAGFNDINSEYI